MPFVCPNPLYTNKYTRLTIISSPTTPLLPLLVSLEDIPRLHETPLILAFRLAQCHHKVLPPGFLLVRSTLALSHLALMALRSGTLELRPISLSFLGMGDLLLASSLAGRESSETLDLCGRQWIVCVSGGEVVVLCSSL